MRIVSVMSLTSMAAIACLLAAPVQGATPEANDTPDIQLGLGESGDSVFNLNDYFHSTEDLTFSASTGATVDADGNVSVAGGDVAGVNTITFTATTAGGDAATVESRVFINAVSLMNAPEIDDNNRIVGDDEGNIFFNGIVPGETVTSNVALGGIPEIGGGVTPGGVSAAALVAAIASVDVMVSDSGFITRDVSVEASGDGSASAGGLTATINPDGSYSLETTSEFSGDWLVSFGVQVGDTVDAVSLLAAAATPVDLSSADGKTVFALEGYTAGDIAFGAGGATVTAGPGEGVIVVGPAVEVGEGAEVTVSLTYESNSANVAIAAIGFDGSLGQGVTYTNNKATNIATGVAKNVATVMTPMTSSVLPAFQVVNIGETGDATVTISSLELVMAGALSNYSVNPNASVDLPVDDSMADLAGWNTNLLQNGAVAPVADTANNFGDGASAAFDAADADANIVQAWAQVSLEAGTNILESYVMRTADSSNPSALYIMRFTEGGANEFTANVVGSTIPNDEWALVRCSNTLSQPSTGFFILQTSFDLNVVVDDIAIRDVEGSSNVIDANLLGL